MKVFQIVFLVVLIIPFAEIYLLLLVGGIIGAFPTIFLVVFTAALGAWLLRQQGFATFRQFQENLAQGVIPAYEMIEGPIILLGGLLLLTPGFITDILGFACLIPPLRKKIAQYVIENHLIQAGGIFSKEKPLKKIYWKASFGKKNESGERQKTKGKREWYAFEPFALSLEPLAFFSCIGGSGTLADTTGVFVHS